MIATRGRGSYQCCRAIVGRTTAKPNAAIRVGRPSPEPETAKQRREGLSTSFPSIERNPHGLSAPHSPRNPKRYAGKQPVQILSPHPRTQTYRTPNRQKCLTRTTCKSANQRTRQAVCIGAYRYIPQFAFVAKSLESMLFWLEKPYPGHMPKAGTHRGVQGDI